MMSLKGEPLGAESLLQPNRNYDAGKSHFMPCANRIYVAKNSSRSRPALVSKAVKTFYSFRKNLLKILSDCREGAREVA